VSLENTLTLNSRCSRHVDSSFLRLGVSDCGIMRYDMVDVAICEQADA